MRTRLYPLALPIVLALAACVPGAADYTKAEAPTGLQVASAENQVVLRFARGSRLLAPGESARLHRLVRAGAIRASDRVTIAAAGGPHLAGLRAETIARDLLRFGIVADSQLLVGVPPDHALIMVGRYLVSLPKCPNWSEKPYSDFTNELSSNFGCATATDLGLMVASPADLASGRALEDADAYPAVSAVDRYLTDKVTLPAEVGGATALAAGAPATPLAPAAAPGTTP
jgi:pilus assembly protein CpaD